MDTYSFAEPTLAPSLKDVPYSDILAHPERYYQVPSPPTTTCSSGRELTSCAERRHSLGHDFGGTRIFDGALAVIDICWCREPNLCPHHVPVTPDYLRLHWLPSLLHPLHNRPDRRLTVSSGYYGAIVLHSLALPFAGGEERPGRVPSWTSWPDLYQPGTRPTVPPSPSSFSFYTKACLPLSREIFHFLRDIPPWPLTPSPPIVLPLSVVER